MTAAPLVVNGSRWVLGDGRARGAFGEGFSAGTAAGVAAGWGSAVVLVVGEPVLGKLWDAEAGHEVTAAGEDGTGGDWRYRVSVPGASDPVWVVLVRRDEHAHGGPWAGLSGTELVMALRVLEHHGVAWSHSVARTAEQLILTTHPRKRGGRLLEKAPAMPGPVTSGRLEEPWRAWSRPLSARESTAAWVHTYDANAAYLGCWQTVELGFGRPEHFSTARGCESRVGQPGVWRVELPPGWHEPAELPPIAPRLVQRDGDDQGKGGWVTTPTLARLRQWAAWSKQGEVVPEEGHVWPERSRFLRAAGERLRDARTEALQGAEAMRGILRDPLTTDEAAEAALSRLVAAEAVKEAVGDLYQIMSGRFSSHRREVAPAWARPDWGNLIRAEWRANLHRKLTRWWADTAAAPFAIETDAVAFATDEADPVAFARWVGLPLGAGLGQWKVSGTCARERVDELAGAGARRVAAIFGAASSAL